MLDDPEEFAVPSFRSFLGRRYSHAQRLK